MPPLSTRRTDGETTSPISGMSGDAIEQHGAMRPHHFARNRRKTLSMSSSVFMMYRVALLCMVFGLASGQGGYDTDFVFTVDEGQPPGFSVGTISTEQGYTYTFSDPPAEFTINRDSGEIQTAVEIDREQIPNDVFDILVLARHSVTSRTKPIEVRITVTDLNDNSPVFPETDISISFTENGRVGSSVILESATDPDKAENGSIVEYSISEGNSENAFRLMVIPGPDGLPIYINLETTVSLDHEIQDFYQLTVEARDNGSPPRSGFVHLNISVLDINDNPPIFDQSDFVIHVNESTPAGTKLLDVHATDGDSGINGEVEYFIDEETSNFNVEPVSGNITLQQKLNYISSDPYQVTVKARDKGVPTQYGRAFLSVYVIDENDHDPQISFSYIPASESFATVSEGVATGSIVALVTVTDEDLAENGEVDLQIISGNEMDHFMLDTLPLLFPTEVQTKVYKILVVGEIDRENIAEYNLTLVAWDNGSPRRRSTGNLLIHVVDTNDHSPEFQEFEYHANLSEGEPIGSFVQSVTATDADFGLNAMILYSITTGNALDWFEINPETGLVTTKALLDREVASVIELNISAADQGIQPRASETTLTVTILDENDEAPEFTSPNYTASVPENIAARFEVTTVTAMDGDEGTSGLVRYELTDDVGHQNPGLFSIDAVSGTIFTEAVLDREETPEYDLHVRAFDSGSPPRESVVSVHINVVDENDNVPVFYPQTYLVTLRENGPAVSFVEQVTATDSDSGNYGNVTYSIVGGNADGKFQINGATGEVMTVTALDREEKSSYTLLIGATDGGGRVAEISAEVRISVGDIQDSPPAFDMSVYEFEIYENANASSFVGSVSATSQDLIAQIRYIIFSGDPRSQFEIDGVTGVIRTTSALDRETTSAYELTVYANGGSMVGSATVRVQVLDVNDNAPQFPRSTDTTDVVENWEVGRHFYHVEATDEDNPPNGDVVYNIVQNPDGIFGINHTTGWMFLNTGLQASVQDEYVVQIVAADLGNPSLSATLELIVSVRDVNNHAPAFAAQHFETSISETTEVNHRFFDLVATDRDQGTNGMISYSILSGNDGDSFGVFPNGEVYVKNFLDREMISEYSLRVEARDHGIPSRTASTELLVEILDENDNRPFFGNSSYTFYLQEGSAVNTVVGSILATDADLGENAELTYTFVGNQTQFSLDRSTGVITNLVGFDREALEAETGQSRFVLDAVVRDGGATPFQDRTSITIIISDINDNPPVFSRSSYQVTISELAENGTHVLRVTASDSDSGDNSYIVYSIVNGNAEGKFQINRISGQITLIGPLDREATSEYSLTVKAQDAGSDPQHNLVEVQVQVLDENDHMPIFTHVEAVLEVTECLAIGQPITMVSATDDDIGENGLISYSITGGDEQKVFRVDPDTGDITLSKLLDHETRSSYTLNITARDSGVPQQTSLTSILVLVRDCNDNSPVFPQHTVVQRIDEELALNTHVVTVSASDPDSGINGQVRYSIVSQEPEGNHFSINPENGSILTSARIDYEYLKVHNGFFKLTVKATDQALPVESRRSATTEVVIFVRNINDNAPVFQTHNAVVISRNAPEGTTVTTVTADDPDDEDSANVTYYIVNRSVPFEINTVSGEISVNEFGFEPNVHMYSVRINAVDSQLTSNYTSLVLNILVLGDSNNGPTFARSMYSGSVSENQEQGTVVVSISAGYPGNPDAHVDYYITSVVAGGVPREGDFQMTRTGVISTGAVLDREQLGQDAMYEVTVYAISGTSAYSSTQVSHTLLLLIKYFVTPSALFGYIFIMLKRHLGAILALDEATPIGLRQI
ncbi:protocadherin Fat 4-like [Patiria miniata]|uniref:Cadherin domain-containing protein n=1 Tax=Patiria miniata TaxID=46514 RepID=A0A913ZWK1_PATMI|nr:protocadherin Fat 4-like [Patiria miniata]